MNNKEETAYIHDLLTLMKDRPHGYFIGDEGMPALGYGMQDYPVLIRRLEEEQLATVNYATSMILTAHGATIARDSGGYKGYLQRQERERTQKSKQEARSANGSLIGGVAGVVAAIIAALALWDSHQTSGELDSLRKQMQQLTQAQATTQARLVTLETEHAATEARSYHNQASTLTRPAIRKSLSPTPARNAVR